MQNKHMNLRQHMVWHVQCQHMQSCVMNQVIQVEIMMQILCFRDLGILMLIHPAHAHVMFHVKYKITA